MAEITVRSFAVEGSLDLAADQFTADVLSADAFLEASDDDEMTFAAGFVDPVSKINYTAGRFSGPIEQYTLSVTPSSITVSISGRDKMVETIEGSYKKMYLRKPPPENPPQIRVVDEHGGMTFKQQPAGTIGPDEIPYVVGDFMASTIAREAVESVGLSLSWQCRDYKILEDFEAVGRPLDIVRKLVEPWSQVDLFRVDLLIEDTVVICRPRAGTFTADYTCSVPDARVKSLEISKTTPACAGWLYGKINLQGKMVPPGLTGTGGGGAPLSSSEVEETSTTETKDGAGQVTSRVVTTTTYRMPDRLVLRAREQIYDKQAGVFQLSSDKDTVNEWESSVYDGSGATNQPKQVNQVVLTSGIHKNDTSKKFRLLQKQETRFTYDDVGYLAMSRVSRWETNPSTWDLEESERETRTLKEVEHLKTEEVVTTLKPKKTTPTQFNPFPSSSWYVATVRTNVSAGVRPGGPRPGRTIVSGGSDGTEKMPLEVQKVVSDDPRAKEVRYANPHMTLADLGFILGQFEAANGKWEYRITVTYVEMPWLRKGKVIHLTGLLLDDGVTEIPLQPALIVSQSSPMEGGESPQSVGRFQAVFGGDP
jgi:hypothetical protein